MSKIKKCLLILSALYVGPSMADMCNEDFCLTENYVKNSFDPANRWDRWKLTKADENWWKWMKVDERGWKRMEVYWRGRKWVKVYWRGWKWMKVDESVLTWMKVDYIKTSFDPANRWERPSPNSNIMFSIRPQNVNFLFTINDVKKVDSENHEITVSILLSMEWSDSRISCKTEVGVSERFFSSSFEFVGRHNLWSQSSQNLDTESQGSLSLETWGSDKKHRGFDLD